MCIYIYIYLIFINIFFAKGDISSQCPFFLAKTPDFVGASDATFWVLEGPSSLVIKRGRNPPFIDDVPSYNLHL